MKLNYLIPTREQELLNQGYDFVIGIDEVGRGAWAGPLYLGAYIFTKDSEILEGINDSKLIPKIRRQLLYSSLKIHKYYIKSLEHNLIDEIGLGKYLNIGLKELISEVDRELGSKKKIFIVDGYFKGEWNSHVIFENKADRNIYSVACASLLAKVERDKYMETCALKYPGYAFEKHVGYGTQTHREALKKLGPCQIHRKSYKPVQKLEVRN